jgi:hypothetical protein
MSQTISLFKSFIYGMTDYIQQHNANATLIESTLNQLLAQLTGQAGGLSVPYGLMEIFDRRGLIGRDSYDFDEGVLSGPNYYFDVDPGAYWDGAGNFYRKATSSTLTLAGKSTGTYYINLDSGGNPLVSSSADGTTTRQFHWDSATHTISAKAIYSGVVVLFDGDDYADQLTSAARAKSFTRVADRLEEIEQLLGEMSAFYAYDYDSGLDFYYKAGKVRNDSVITDTPAGHVTCVNAATNYIEVDPATGTVSVNQAGFTSGLIPLHLAVAAGGIITSHTDKRTWAISGTGGGGGGHTQNTDVGTTASEFLIDMDATGSPSGRAGLGVENGDDPNAYLKFDRDTGHWVYSEDGGTIWKTLGDFDPNFGAQELTKYVAKEDPDLALEDLARDSSVDYEDLDLSLYIGALQGIQAVVLRIQFFDDAPGEDVNVKFKKKGSAFSPALAYTVWANSQQLHTLVIPTDDDYFLQYFVTASGAGTANLRVFVVGYLEKVTGVGTQDRTLIHAGISVGSGATVDTNIASYINRGLTHYLKVRETGALVTGNYDVHLYAKDTFLAADLLYKAEGVSPASDYEDWLPFWLQDKDLTKEVHCRIINHDLAQTGVYEITLTSEQFA